MVQRQSKRGQIKVAGDKLVLDYPIEFHSKDGFHSISGTVDFGLHLHLSSVFNETSKKTFWDLILGHADSAKIDSFICPEARRDCSDIKKYMETKFQQHVLTFTSDREHVYDQPTVVRYFQGVLGYIKDFNKREIETSHLMFYEE